MIYFSNPDDCVNNLGSYINYHIYTVYIMTEHFMVIQTLTQNGMVYDFDFIFYKKYD